MPALDTFLKGRTAGPLPIVLTRRDIFILPTRAGIWFGLLLLALLLISINYDNNLTYFMVFLLAGTAFLSTLATYRELSGLSLVGTKAEPVFAGNVATFRVLVRAGHRSRQALDLSFRGTATSRAALKPGSTAEVEIGITAPRRGWLRPGPVLVETRFPLGLFRAWSRPDPEAKVLVYPAPARDSLPLALLRTKTELGRDVPADEFQGLRRYRPGDPPSRIEWRALAREQGLTTRSFRSGSMIDGLILDLAVTPGRDLEERLSRLTRAVLDAHGSDLAFGLRLGPTFLDPARGKGHLNRALEALALHGQN